MALALFGCLHGRASVRQAGPAGRTRLADASGREVRAGGGGTSGVTGAAATGGGGNAALRFVRVDQGFKVTEKDPAAAYVMFDYRSAESGDKVTPGSIEVIPSGQTVKVIVQLSQMPRYHEQVLADGLARKLRTEYGEPVKKQPPAAPDAGADASPE